MASTSQLEGSISNPDHSKHKAMDNSQWPADVSPVTQVCQQTTGETNWIQQQGSKL